MPIGIGICQIFNASNVFSPDSYFPQYNGFWNDLDASNAIIRAVQPNLLDGECSDVSKWTLWESPAAGGCSLSNDLVTFYSGASSMKVNIIAGSVAGGSQSILTTGCRYRFTGATRSDGAYGCQIRTSGGATAFSVSASTSWTTFSSEADAASSVVYYRNSGVGGADGYVLWDALAIENLSVTSAKNKGTSDTFAQSTPTSMPYEKTLGSKKSLYFDTGDNVILGSDRSTQRWLHDGYGCTISVVFTIPSVNTNHGILGTTSGSTANGARLLVLPTGAIQFGITNGSTYNYTAQSAAGVIVSGKKHLAIINYNSANGVKVYVDGQLVASDSTITSSVNTGDATYLLTLGGLPPSGTNIAGQIADAYGVAKYISGAELSQLERYFATKHGIKLINDTLTDTELATWSGLVSWVDPTYTGVLTKANQPNLLDGNMELDGYASWGAIDSSLSKQSGSRPGGTGTKVLRVTCNVATYFASQSLCTLGNQYRVRGWARPSGADAPAIYNGAYIWTGTTSTAWQYFDVTYTALAGGVLFGSAGGTVGAWIEFDDITIENLSVTAVAERVGGNNYSQATAANMPWTNTSNWLTYDSTGDDIIANRAKSTHRFMHDGTGGTVISVVSLNAYDASLSCIFGTMSGTSSSSIGQTAYFTSTGVFYVQVANGLGAPHVYSINSGATTVPLSTKTIVTTRVNSAFCDLRKNDNQTAVSTSPAAAFSANDSTNFINLGNFGGGGFAIDGSIGEFMVFSRILSSSELYRLNRYLSTKHTITL